MVLWERLLQFHPLRGRDVFDFSRTFLI